MDQEIPFPQTAKGLKLIRRLGQRSRPDTTSHYFGSNSAVYLAEVPNRCQPVALKIAFSWSAEAHTQIEEIKIHSFLSSLEGSQQYIVQFYTFWTEMIDFTMLPAWESTLATEADFRHNQCRFLLCQYVPYNLAQFRNQNALNEEEICLIVYQIAKGIAFLQSHNFAHRDLKPDNVLIDDAGKVLLSDFETAVQFDPEQKLRCLCEEGMFRGGAPLYRPPEIGTTPHGPDVWLDYSTYDTYSLGIIIYNLFRFEAPEPSMIDISDEFHALLTGMISSDPKTRFHVDHIIDQTSLLLAPFLYRIGNKTLLQSPVIQEIRTANQTRLVERARAFELAALEGEAKAQGHLGLCYVNGVGVPKDEALGFQYLLKAAETGLHDAEYNVAVAYRDGTGVSPDIIKGREYMERAAVVSTAAQFSLGVYYHDNAHGIPQDLKLGVHYFELAAKGEHVEAMFRLGHCHEFGIGIEKDKLKALAHYQQAALRGHLKALERLGICASVAMKNEARAFESHKLGAEQGDAGSQFFLGTFYRRGVRDQIRQLDEDLATACWKLAAEQGHAEAQANLGFCYVNGDGVKKDPELGVQYYEQAVAQGHVMAHSNLGYCYANGIGVKRNAEAALKCYEFAAMQGSAEAQLNLGISYFKSQPQDIHSAVKYFTMAADAGINQARNHLAMIYQKGIGGIEQNIPLGMKYFIASADDGDAVAQWTLGKIYQRGIGVRPDEEAATNYYQLSAAQGNAEAQCDLGLMYFDKDDTMNCVKFLALAAQQKHPQALEALVAIGLPPETLQALLDRTMPPPAADQIPHQCTVGQTGNSFVLQPFYNCDTCWPDANDLGCCSFCAQNCHAGHKVNYRGHVNCFCDCGATNPACGTPRT